MAFITKEQLRENWKKYLLIGLAVVVFVPALVQVAIDELTGSANIEQSEIVVTPTPEERAGNEAASPKSEVEKAAEAVPDDVQDALFKAVANENGLDAQTVVETLEANDYTWLAISDRKNGVGERIDMTDVIRMQVEHPESIIENAFEWRVINYQDMSSSNKSVVLRVKGYEL